MIPSSGWATRLQSRVAVSTVQGQFTGAAQAGETRFWAGAHPPGDSIRFAATGVPRYPTKMRPPLLYLALAVLMETFARGATENFLAGADMSHLKFFESRGVFYQHAGQTQDALAILKQHGLNCVRLRLFTSNAAQAVADPYNYINNLDYTVPLAMRVKNTGLQFHLDFHYSDTWADPGHQAVPSAWTNLTFAALVQQMHSYNSNTIAVFRTAGAMPDYVSIGNEITSGFLWPHGQVGGSYENSAQWSQLGQLLKAAIQGVQDAATGTLMPKIILHIDRGGDWSTTQWFFDNLNAQGVPFDIIGESYYPFWHGPLSNLSNCLNQAANRYQKPVIVAETAFPWTNSHWPTAINGISPSITGQIQYVVALAPIIKGVAGGRGVGGFWWGTEYQNVAGVNEAGFDTTSFFDARGNLLPAANAFGQLTVPLVLNISSTSNGRLLTWPLSGAGLSLMTTTDLKPPAVWSPITAEVQNTGSLYWLNLPPEASAQRFYRLQSNW